MPLRLAEFGLVHRFERSGVLTGLIRPELSSKRFAYLLQERPAKNELIEVLKLFKESTPTLISLIFGIACLCPISKTKKNTATKRQTNVGRIGGNGGTSLERIWGKKYEKSEGKGLLDQDRCADQKCFAGKRRHYRHGAG